ncbi:Transcriptional regulator [Methylacidimicrobium sp. AP8]|uniref:type IV toxin-antitoxin system AbiEi family antitoxin domain-containing protein n=1 Tax=Methylacidimicrobium sp. AP8 TaxID=2730359 RepID=UPI0018C0B48C|nr:type IV toxin-antitoxin system AbiEi family antitoxin [Methylacidimicrobium sp. AP8]CAB4243787.1 Transcriptional regulator [Methylacidimicrobium sp. AP8]
MTHSAPLKTLGAQSARLVTELHERRRMIFRLDDVREITGLSRNSARSLTHKLVARGVADRLRSGLYILAPSETGEHHYFGDPFVVARELMRGEDYYISHGSALEFHNMTTQPQLVITVSIPHPRRAIWISGVEFRFVRCPREHFFGIVEDWSTAEEKVRVSDLEKTVVDGLKQPQHCGGLTEVAKGLWMRRDDISVDRLIQYAQRLGVGAVARRLGYVLETYEMASETDLARLRAGLTETYVLVDPIRPREGRRLHRWRLVLNVEPEELVAVVST